MSTKSGRLANWAEVVETGVILFSLVLLILEVRDNTRALKLQAYMDRAEAHVRPYFDVEDFDRVYAKIKAVDTEFPEAAILAFQDRYEMTQREALLWVRHMDDLWLNFEGDYLYGADRETLASDLATYLSFPDQQMYYAAVYESFDPAFQAFVRDLPGVPPLESMAAMNGGAP